MGILETISFPTSVENFLSKSGALPSSELQSRPKVDGTLELYHVSNPA